MKKFLFSIFILALWFVPHTASAASMVLQTTAGSVDQQQQFAVDVLLDAQGSDFNGIQGSIAFSSNLSFVRAETGTSILSYFIDQPTVKGDAVSLSGIVVGGFNGLINPFNQSRKFPGEIVRLVFAGNAPGTATITTSNFSVTANDGYGTLQQVPDNAITLNVSDTVAPSMYNTPDTIPPTITASVVHDTNLYGGKYALIFDATDKQSGIDHVALQEGDGPWLTIQSPYVLHDQTRNSILSLRAYDVAGNVTTITLPAAGSQSSAASLIILILIALIIVYVVHRKTKHPKHITG